MLTLVFDTSTERGMVALLQGERVLQSIDLPAGYNNAQYLVTAIQELCSATGVTLQQVQLIGVGIGPGSYTGIRVGAAVAKGLSMALRIPLVGVPTLMGFLPSRSGPFLSIIDARTGGAYFLFGNRKENSVEYIGEPAMAPLSELVPKIPHGLQLVTPQATILRPKLEALAPTATWRWEESGPDATHLGHLALERHRQGLSTLDCRLELLYLRKTQAEIEHGH